MNTTTQTMHHHDRFSAFKSIASGSVMEAIVAIAVVALAIIGLAGVYSPTLAAIATIITAAAILIEGGVFEAASRRTEGVLSAGALGALAGMILGILALMGVAPITLLSIAVLVFGVTWFLSGSSVSERGWAAGPMDGRLLMGLSVMVLGLLAVIGISSLTLVLVGLLILGAAALFGGSLRAMHEAKAS